MHEYLHGNPYNSKHSSLDHSDGLTDQQTGIAIFVSGMTLFSLWNQPQTHRFSKQICVPTSDGLRVRGEHKQFDEGQTERGVVVLPDDSGDEEDLAITGQQQGSEEKAELEGPAHHRPKEAQHAAAERRQLCTSRRTDMHGKKC